MIDFSALQGLTIPEGVVTQISDASGAVLWSAARMATVTIAAANVGITGSGASITVTSDEPFAPDPSDPSFTTNTWEVDVWEEPRCTIEIPTGSTIECIVNDKGQGNRCYVSVDGVKVLTEPGVYLYTVTGNVTVIVESRYSSGEYGVITITKEGR